MEQVIFALKKSSKKIEFETGQIDQCGLKSLACLRKSTLEKFGIFLTGLTNDEIAIGIKVQSGQRYFSDICEIKRGLDIQEYLSNSTYKKVLRCKSIGRYILKETKDGLSEDAYVRLRNIVSYMEKPKIIIQNIVAHVTKPTNHIIIMATVDNEGLISLGSVGNIFLNDDRYNNNYLIAIINSKIISWYVYRFIYGNAIRTMRFDNYHLKKIPIRTINFDNPKEKALHNKLVALVDRMLELNKKKQTLPISSEREAVEREIAVTDEKIDDLVYELYGITDKERKIIEASI